MARSLVVPSPSWPVGLYPQQYASPAVVMPQVCNNPAVTDDHTVILTDVVALTDPTVAVIVTTPPCTEVTKPVEDTVAVLSSELDQVTGASSTRLPFSSRTVAVSRLVSPSVKNVSESLDSSRLAAS